MRLYEAMIAAAGISLLFAVCNCNALGFNKRAAEENAHEWATEIGIKADHIVCGSSDTDGDGYVSCNFNVSGEVHTYECAGYAIVIPHDGCREPKVKVPTRR